VFRVSSVDGEAKHAFEVQAGFIDDLVSALPPASRTRLAGL